MTIKRLLFPLLAALLLSGCASRSQSASDWNWRLYGAGDGAALAIQSEEGAVLSFEIVNWHLYDTWEEAAVPEAWIPTVSSPSGEPERPYELVQGQEKLLLVTVAVYNNSETKVEARLQSALTSTSGEPAESADTFYIDSFAVFSDRGTPSAEGNLFYIYTFDADAQGETMYFGFILQQEQVEELKNGYLGLVLTEKESLNYTWTDEQKPLRFE